VLTKEELLAELTDLKARVAEINTQYGASLIDPESADGQEWNTKNERIDEIQQIVQQLEAREHRIAELASNPENTDRGSLFNTAPPGATRGQDIYDLSTVRSSLMDPEQAATELVERAHRAIDTSRFPHPDVDQAAVKAHLTRLVGTIDDPAAFAKHMLVTGSPTYQRAFGKALLGQHLQAQEMQALSLGGSSGAEGGYAVPVTLDPTIIPISDGVVNPLRAMSRVVQITGKTWEGVTASAVTAYRGDEGSEATETSPTLAQPSATPGRVSAWIEATFEISQDWGSIQSDLAMLIQDAKDVEESTSFVNGAGTGTGNNAVPEGITVGATLTVTTSGSAAFASTDLDLLEDALPQRFLPRAAFLGSRTIYNAIRHFDDYGGPDLWVRISDPLGKGGNTGRTLLGYPAYEASAMKTTHAANELFLVLGDFSRYFLIVDRIGMSIELVPHLFGANRLPTGQRGFYAFWRNTSKVLSANAFRVLKAKAT
jgi:HK97 family phage major capsid protein